MRLAILPLILAVSGCSIPKPYSAVPTPNIKATEFATIHTQGGAKRGFFAVLELNTYITDIDEKSTFSCLPIPFFMREEYCHPRVAYLLPGPHKLMLRSIKNSGSAFASINVNVEAGKNYIVKHELIKGEVRYQFDLLDEIQSPLETNN